MAEYLIQDTTLTGFADEVRTMTDTESGLSTSQIQAKLVEANEEIDNQAALLTTLLDNLPSIDWSMSEATVIPLSQGGTGGKTPEQARSNLEVPPINHASTSSAYGVGTSTKYGHVILYNSSDCTTYTTDSGGACTPAAVKKAVELFGGAEAYQVGDTFTTARTNLGDKWLLCNGEQVKVADAPLLTPLLGGENSFIIDEKDVISVTYPKAINQWRNRKNTLIANGKILVFNSGYDTDTMPGLTVYYKDIEATTWSQKTIDSNIKGRDCVGAFYIEGYYIVCVATAKGIGRMYYSSNLTSWSYKEFSMGDDDDYPILATVSYANGYWFIFWGIDEGKSGNSWWSATQKLYYSSSIGGTYAKVSTSISYDDCLWGQGVAYFNGRYMFVKNYYNPGYSLRNSRGAIFYGTSPNDLTAKIESSNTEDIPSNVYQMGKYKIINNECIFYGQSQHICVVNSSFAIKFNSFPFPSSFTPSEIYYKDGIYTFVGGKTIFRYYGTSLWNLDTSKFVQINLSAFQETTLLDENEYIVNMYDETNNIILRAGSSRLISELKQQKIYVHGTVVLPNITYDKVYTYIKKE